MTDINAVIERLEKAKITLGKVRQGCLKDDPTYADTFEARRLSGKIEGVDLALSYLREEQ